MTKNKKLSYWNKNKGTLQKLIDQGYRFSTHPEVFLKELPPDNKGKSKSPGAIERAIRRFYPESAKTGSKKIETESDIESLVEADLELITLKREKQVTQRKYQLLLKQQTTFNRLFNMLKEEVEFRPTVEIPKPFISTSKTHQPVTVVSQIGDIHFGEKVSPEVTMGLGNYTRDITKDRLAFLVEKTLLITKEIVTGHPYNKMVVNLLGDMICGNIHAELLETADGRISEWIFDIATVLSMVVLEFAREFPLVEVNGVSGNHGRFNKKPSFKLDSFDNWDYIIYQIMSIILRDQKNVSCYFPKSPWCLADINGFSSLLIHGNNIRSYYGVPYYGISKTATKLSDLINIGLKSLKDKENILKLEDNPIWSRHLPFRYIEMGHFHTMGILNHTSAEIIMNGSVIGNGEYNLGAMSVGEDPKQWLLLAHPEQGYTGRFPINLSEAPEGLGKRYCTEGKGTIGTVGDQVTKLIERI